MKGPAPAAADAMHGPVLAATDAMHGPVPVAADAIQGGMERTENGDEPLIETCVQRKYWDRPENKERHRESHRKYMRKYYIASRGRFREFQ